MPASQFQLLKEAMNYLGGALSALDEERRQSRLARLHRWLFKPLSILGGLSAIVFLSLVFFALGCRGRHCFSLGVLCYMIPLLVHVWRASDDPHLKHFWPEIRRSDEAIGQMGDQELLLWPVQHAEDVWKMGATVPELREAVKQRLEQIQLHLESIPPSERVEVEAPPPEAPKPIETQEFIVD